VKIAELDRRAALAIDGAAMFDPMGTGRIMHDTALLPESVMDEPDELRAWLRKALDYTATQPPKKTRATATAKAPAAKKTTKNEHEEEQQDRR